MAKKLIPDYDFSLGATPQQQKGSIQSLYDKIAENEKSIYARINAPKIGGAGGLNYYDIERNFVKKRGDDIIYGNISVDAELKSTGFNENTNGWRLSKDTNGKGRLDIDDIYVRNSITTQILTYEKINATGGSLLLSSAWCTVESSEVLGTGSTRVIRIYYKPDGYNIQRWMEYDQAIIKSGLDKYLMSVVTSVSTTPDADGRFWIELYYGGGASGAIQPYYEQEGVYIPVAGDVVVQYGYRKSDAPSRQNIIKISVGDGLNSFPYIEQYRGINSFDFSNKLITRISDDVYFGNGDQTKYIWWNKDNNSELLLKGTLVQSPTGATMPNVFWRGYYSAAETYYRGDLVQYLGVNYISIYDGAHSQNTPPNPTYWEIFVDKGADGNSGADGAGYEIAYIGVSDTSDPNETITNNPYVDNYLPSPLWSHTLIQPSPTNLYVWSTIRRKPAGQAYWNDFEPAVIIYKYTTDGVDGDDGTGYQTIYTSTANKDTYPTYINPSANYLSEGWSDTPTGVSPLLRAQWRSIRVSTDGVWGNFSTAALDSTYSADGEDGEDGLYVKYIYKRTQTPTAPAAPSDAQNWAVDGWTDDPMGVTPEYPYEFISYSQYDPNTGLYGAWSTPKEWSRYAFSGMAIRFTRWQVGVMYYDGTYSAGNPLRYKDYVVDIDYAGVVRAYECISEHLSFYSGRPILNDAQSNELWSNISYVPAIATDVLLANQAVIGGFMFSAAMENFNAIPPTNQYLRTTDSATNPSILMKGDGYASFAKGNVFFDSNGNATIKGFINAVSGRIGNMEIDGGLNAAGIEISPTPMQTIAQLSSPSSENLTSTYYDDEAIDENVYVQVANIYPTFTGRAMIKVDFSVDSIQFDNTTYDVIISRGSEIFSSHHGNLDNAVQNITILDIIPVNNGENWTIDAFITVGDKFGSGSQTNYVKVYGDGAGGQIINSSVVEKTKLSSDGFFSFWTPDDYVYFKNAGQFEVRKGYFGMRMSPTEFKKWDHNTQSWVDIDYSNW